MNQLQQLDMFRAPVENPAKFSVFDLETGGLDEKRNGLCSVAIVSLGADLEEINRYYSLLYEPGKVYDAEALRINGFAVEQLQNEGLQPNQFIPVLHGLLDGSIVVAHNAQFDVRWLNARGWDIQEAVCTMELSFKTWPMQKAKLGIVYQRMYGSNFEGAHNSLYDTLATVELLKWYQKKDPTLLNPVPINWNRFRR